MNIHEIKISIEKRYANKQIIEKMKVYIKDNKGKWSGKINLKDVKYNSDESNNYYTFKVETKLQLKNAAEYIRTITEKLLKKLKIKPFIVSSKSINESSNLMRFSDFKIKYI